MRRSIPLYRVARLALGCAAALSIGCAAEAPSSHENSKNSKGAAAPAVSWEAFLRSVEPTMRVVNGEKVYRVEWDIPLRESELHDYYRRNYVETEKSIAARVAYPVPGKDNKWATPDHLNLTYCVSTDFGNEYHTRIQAEMERATLAWTRAVGVRFIYLSDEDKNCVNISKKVKIPVRPFSEGSACAFLPTNIDVGPRCSKLGLALFIDIKDIERLRSEPIGGDGGDIHPNVTTEGTLRHELGHILGLEHEHVRQPDNNEKMLEACNDVSTLAPEWYRALTDYDVNSVMHYPWCDGVITSDQSITVLDGQGASRLYGPPAWRVALL